MNTLRNKVNLMGRLGAQPEIMKFESGKTLARFTIATKEAYKTKNGDWNEDIQWHTINAWGKIAEKAEKLLHKGQEILLEGKLVHQSYETTEGLKKHATVIEVNEFILLNKATIEQNQTLK